MSGQRGRPRKVDPEEDDLFEDEATPVLNNLKSNVPTIPQRTLEVRTEFSSRTEITPQYLSESLTINPADGTAPARIEAKLNEWFENGYEYVSHIRLNVMEILFWYRKM